eukprot:5079407-Pyramimonas_sp.AAC.1
MLAPRFSHALVRGKCPVILDSLVEAPQLPARLLTPRLQRLGSLPTVELLASKNQVHSFGSHNVSRAHDPPASLA